jgi:hypothetical protein
MINFANFTLISLSPQEEMHNMSVHFCDFVNKSGSQGKQNKGDRSPATKANRAGSTFAGMPPPPMFVGLATMPVASTSSKENRKK